MLIGFKTNKLSRIFNSMDLLKKTYGPEQARKIALRIKVLEAAPCLADVSTLPPERRHELKGNRKGQFAVDIAQPFRIIFLTKEAIPKGKGGRIDLSKVTKIVILGVEDYHGD